MPATVILGGQWGDEGKAKVVDFLMSRHDVVLRFQGGANAGHTVVNDDGTFKFHQIPSGILYPDVTAVMGNGMVIDPFAFRDELGELLKRSIDVAGRLLISSAAQVVMPHHKFIDSLMEGELKKNHIGSTGKGIGPAYSSKHSRRGMRMSDFLLSKEELHELVTRSTEWGNRYVELFGAPPLSAKKIAADFVNIQELISPMIIDTQELVTKWKADGKNIMLEGAQGTLLDIDHGTYPYVTSSNCSIGGAISGSGLAPRDIGRAIGIFKAYATRVGNGPFPTELEDETGDCLRDKGREFGTTTGRPRRCGWFDLVAARYAVNLNGLEEIALTKLDVLSGQEKIRFCVAYELDGERIGYFPQNVHLLNRCKPIYEEMPGWPDQELGRGDFEDLPENAKAYVRTLEERLGIHASFISTGPERSSTIVREDA
ncbi:MAG: adenylosuccinate synthase [Candidatus Krumholzibacteria bacterium]|nr:adenylosuccinate synthase [Candidatus Krumholzibacteria bacterium]